MAMKSIRQQIGGLGNLMFKEARLYAEMRDGLIPDVYVQSYKYWAKYADEIKHMYSEGMELRSEKVSLHIRRGDYVDNPFYIDLTKTDYYKKAVELFPNEEFLVFCKDNQNKNIDARDRYWAIDYMNTLGVSFTMAPEWNTETEDMNLMGSCKSNIGANSSFSWWGAFLNPSPHKIVVMPSNKNWFSDGIERIECPVEWIRI